MLVVIAIIGILAGLILGVAGGAGPAKIRSRVKTELKALEAAIDDYHKKLGYYPQSNKGNTAQSALYHELTGDTGYGVLTNDFGIVGIANIKPNGKNFYPNMRPSAYVLFKQQGSDKSYLLTVPYKGPNPITGLGGEINPWHYNAHSPVHNPDGYDLWAEVVIGNKTNIISNWED